MQHARRVPLAAAAAVTLTLAVGGVVPAAAQQTPASDVPRSTFPNIRNPLSAGLNPAASSPFFPDIRQPLSGTFTPNAFTPFGVAPVGMLGAGGAANFSPFVPDIRQPLSGSFNPAAAVPFNGVFGTATSVPAAVLPGAGGFPMVNGFPANTGLGNTPFFVTPSGAVVTAGGTAVPYWGASMGAQPVAVPVYVPVYVPVSGAQAGSASASRTTRQRPSDRPGTARTRGYSAATRERLSTEAAERMMARRPLTEGTVISDGAQGVQVRVGGQTRRYSRSQVFFFTNRGEMRNGSIEPTRLARGRRVLVPVAVGATARAY
jgi:hypothetical protein